jgi:hypothetical protein
MLDWPVFDVFSTIIFVVQNRYRTLGEPSDDERFLFSST